MARQKLITANLAELKKLLETAREENASPVAGASPNTAQQQRIARGLTASLEIIAWMQGA